MRKLSLTFFCMISALSAFGRTMCLLHRMMNRATKITAVLFARLGKITAASAPVRARCSAMSESRSRRKFHNRKTQDLHFGRPCVFSCSNAKDVLQPQLHGAAQAHLAVQRGVDGLDQRLAVAVECTAEGKVV